MVTLKHVILRLRRGAAAAELAIVGPLFLMVCLGIIEFGRSMMANKMVTTAAREGARMAAADGSTNAEVVSSIQAFMNSTLAVPPSNVNVAITTKPADGNPDPANVVANCQAGDLVTVKVEVPFESVALIPGTYLAGKVMVGESAMRHE